MKKNIFLQKLIFTLTSGSLLFYLVSFDSNGHSMSSVAEVEQCRVDLQRVRSGRPVVLKQQFQVVPRNVLKLAPVEQRLLTHYMHLTGINLVRDGNPNPIRITSYKMESANKRNMGFKVVIDAENEKEDILTYYTNKGGDILFWYWDSFQPLQEWTCGQQD